MQRLRKDAPHGIRDAGVTRELCLIADAYRAGAQWALDQRAAATEAELQQRADQELEACCEWTRQDSSPEDAASLRAARRPKPPSLNEQALLQLKCIDADLRKQGIINTDKIRLALEALPND